MLFGICMFENWGNVSHDESMSYVCPSECEGACNKGLRNGDKELRDLSQEVWCLE